jgi:uroporphyrinogen III methyltransferase/synthase
LSAVAKPYAATGTVYLVGAGPGDPALLTRRGADLLGVADVVVYDGLLSAVLLDLAPAAAERIYAGKKHTEIGPPLSQGEIIALLIDRARAGARVVRLKGGDPFVFGRGAEEACALAAAGVPFEIVPGVSAATAVNAYAGIPLTARGIASTVAFATGHEAAGKPSTVDWEGLARADTIVLFMALVTLDECAARLLAAGRDPGTPAAAIYWGTTAAQKTVVSTLGRLAADVRAVALRPPVLVTIGEVVRLREKLDWYERRPLFGARVLVTRPLEQARRFAQILAERGAEPVFAPVTRLLPPRDRTGIAGAIDRIDSYEWFVFTSANAVERFFAELGARELDARALGLARVACVGPVTAAALRERGVRADVVPAHGDAQAAADAVVEFAKGAIREARVLIPRAEHGRDEAVAALEAAGAVVEVAPVYRTETVAADDPSISLGLRRLRAGQIDVAAFFAPSQVRSLFEICGDETVALLTQCRLVLAIGGTTERTLAERAVRVDLVPSAPDATVLVDELCDVYAARAADPARPRKDA